MKLSEDQKIRRLFENWISIGESIVRRDVEQAIARAPEMTPIEQIVFLRLRAAQLAGNIITHPQVRIRNYRVDFIIELSREDLSKYSRIIVECDGHDFHEKTREQAAHDKKRDRDLQSLGFKVYHFTGSEIWNTDGRCVIDALGA